MTRRNRGTVDDEVASAIRCRKIETRVEIEIETGHAGVSGGRDRVRQISESRRMETLRTKIPRKTAREAVAVLTAIEMKVIETGGVESREANGQGEMIETINLTTRTGQPLTVSRSRNRCVMNAEVVQNEVADVDEAGVGVVEVNALRGIPRQSQIAATNSE